LEDRTALLDGLVRTEHHGKSANHEHNGAPSGRFGENVGRATWTKSGLAACAAKGAGEVSGFAALQQHNNDENEAIQNKKRRENPRAAPRQAKAQHNDPKANEQRDGPFHPSWHFKTSQ
jgi:hypothetical protein